MRLMNGIVVLSAVTLCALPGWAQQQPQQPMTFFVASAGSGNGGNLGGLAGADAICQRLGASAGRGDQPNRHDMLTGSDSMGRAAGTDPAAATCNNWASGSDDHRAMLGHHDRQGGPNASWNAVHSSRGCSQTALVGTGGDGLFYCFAAQ